MRRLARSALSVTRSKASGSSPESCCVRAASSALLSSSLSRGEGAGLAPPKKRRHVGAPHSHLKVEGAQGAKRVRNCDGETKRCGGAHGMRSCPNCWKL